MTPTKEQMIEEIRAACIKANPDGLFNIWVCPACNRIYEKRPGKYCEDKGCTLIRLEYRERPIRLADVLFAIDNQNLTIEAWTGFLCLKGQRQGVSWNLRADDLEAQSDETLAFISSLLGK